MSFLVKQPSLPQAQAGSQQQESTYREADPIGLGYGCEVWGSHWISKDFNWKTAKAKNNQPDYQYASIAAAYRAGPIDFVGKVFQDGKAIVDFAYVFAPGEDSHEFVINSSLALGQAWKVTVYRGSESQQANATLIAGTGRDQPAYRGICWALWENIDLGSGQTTIPSLSLELGQRAPDIGAYSDLNTTDDFRKYGVNPFAAIYGFATEPKGGLGDDGSIFDPAHWGAQAAALEATGIGQRTGAEVHCHPMLSQAQDAATFFSNILSYVDGFIHPEGDALKVGWFPHAAPAVGSLPEIVEGDLDGKPSGNGFGDASAGPSEVVVIFHDQERRYMDSPASASAPANLETGLVATPLRKERPFIHDKDQAAIVAAELAAEAGAGSDDGVNLSILKSRAVDGTGAPLMPGALLNWDYGPHSRDLVCRVVSRRMRAGSASDVLTVIRERGAYPRPYVAPVDARVLPVDDLPGEINPADVRLWFLPSGLNNGTRQVAPLVNRAKRTIYRADLHLSPSGAAPWEIVLDSRFFAAKCAVDTAGITAASAIVRVSSTSVDFARMAAQSTVAQTDDTLLLLIGDEVMSVGSITTVAPGIYDLALLRGRQGTTASAHAIADVAWLFYRSELQASAHAEFHNVRDGLGAYSAAIATKRFKIALFTIYADGLAKPDDPGLSLVLPDLTADEVAAAAGYTVLLTSEAHTVACDAAGNVNAGQLGAGSLAKTDVKAFKGAAALALVTAAPGDGQYAISLGALTNTTATKEADDTVRCDTLTADTGTIAIAVHIGGVITVSKTFTLTKALSGAVGAAGAPGAAGTPGTYTDYIFKRAAAQPVTPTGDTPAGWSDGPPAADGNPLWLSRGDKTAAGALIGVWSTPTQIEGDGIGVEYSVDGATAWHANFTAGDKYMRQRIGVSGAWSAAIKIVGENGAPGTPGAQGIPGPGMVYQGAYSAAATYYKTDNRVDVVSYAGNYYPTANAAKSGTATWGAPGGADWGAAFTNFKAVATDLLLASDATILKTLVMGDGVTAGAGIIRSAGANSFGAGLGFWLGYDGATPKFRVGNPAGNRLTWDGSQLDLVGTVTATSGAIGGFNLGSTTLSSSSGNLSLDAGNSEVRLTSGSAEARLRVVGANPMFEVLSGGLSRGRFAWDFSLGMASLTFLDAAGGLTTSMSQAGFSGPGSGLTGLNASNITSGTLDNARLPNNLSVSGTLSVPGAVGSVGGIKYNNGSTNFIAFYWDGANVRAVVDGTLQGTIPNP